MQVTALTPALQAPAPAASGTQAAKPGHSDGPESFSAALDAADTQRNADAPATAEARPAGPRPSTRPPGGAPRGPGHGSARGPDDRHPAGASEPAEPAAGKPGKPGEDPTLPWAEAVQEAPGSDMGNWLAGLGVFVRPETGIAESLPRGTGGFAAASANPTAAITEPGDPAAADPRAGPATAAGAGSAASSSSRGASSGFAGLLGAAKAGDRTARAERSEMPAGAADSEPLRERLAAAETTAAPATVLATRVDGPGVAPLQAQAGAGAGGTPVGRHLETPAEASLPATPGSPEFKDQLGAQLTTFVREGVQHARLQLHPLELGPVTVQIQIDGGSAQVNFAAEHAHTRQALEQAMPALAGSLRESGLTLSGGGVFEQPRQTPQEAARPSPAGRGRREGSGAAEDLPALSAAPTLRRRGVVDLIA